MELEERSRVWQGFFLDNYRKGRRRGLAIGLTVAVIVGIWSPMGCSPW